MGKNIFSFFIFFFILTSCFKMTKEDPVLPENINYDEEIGPFFLPENPFFTSVSINYFTSISSSTRVLFSMVGNIDWLREDKNPKNFHCMKFFDLEENAIYKFEYLSQNGQRQGFIRTLPYGREYEFTFCVTSLEYEIKDDFPVGFTVLVSGKNTIEFKDFAKFYEKNKNHLTSTISVPLFGVIYSNQILFSDYKKLIYFKYKDVSIIGINEKIDDYDYIMSFIPPIESSKTYIILGNIGRDEVKKISKKVFTKVEKIFVYKDSFINEEKVVSIERPIFITVSKNGKYAINLKMQLK